MFDNFITEGIEEVKDTVTSSYEPLETDVYDAIVKLFYIEKRPTGSGFVHIHLDINGHEHQEKFCIASKEGKNYYEKNGKKNYLPGYAIANDLAMLTTKGKNLVTLMKHNTSSKVIEVYNWQTSSKEKVEVPVIVDIINKPIKVALLKLRSNKTKYNSSTQSNVLLPEEKIYNQIQKFLGFNSSKTIREALHKTDSVYYNDFIQKKKGTIKDTFKQIESTQTNNSNHNFNEFEDNSLNDLEDL